MLSNVAIIEAFRLKRLVHAFIEMPLIYLLLVLVFFIGQMPCLADQLTLVTVENSADTQTSEAVLTTAYQKLGIEVMIKHYPAERALRMAVAGQVDGAVQRIDGVRVHYPDLIQIKPSINYLEAVVFTHNTKFTPTNWESLRPYRIGLIRGIKFAENNTQGMNRNRVNSYHSLFTMLAKDRIEAAVAPRINGLAHLRHSGIQDIRELTPPIGRFELFHYLHKKNQHLTASISRILSEMQTTGEFERIRKRVTNRLLRQTTSEHFGRLNALDCGVTEISYPRTVKSDFH